MGYIGTTVSLRGVIGPMLGGFLVGFLGWRASSSSISIGIVLLAVAARYMRLEEVRHKIELDWMGTAMLITFMISLNAVPGKPGLRCSASIPQNVFGNSDRSIIGGFYLDRITQRAPILDLSIFRVKKFVLPIISMLLLFIISSFTIFILGPFYFQGVMGYTPAQVGTVFLIYGYNGLRLSTGWVDL